MSKASLKKFFIQMCQQNTIPTKSNCRIATFNIHYWTDICDESSIDKLFEDFAILNADILCLQEVSFDVTKFNPYTYNQLMEKFKSLGYIDYTEIVCCNYIGSRYGNMILSKFPLKNKSSGILYQGKTRVKRGYCLAYIHDMTVCCTHLDVFDESGETRYKQMSQLLSILTRYKNNVICGDFNCIRKQDYTEKRFKEILESDLKRKVVTDTKTLSILGEYKSCFDNNIFNAPKLTVWSNRIVDFIFVETNFDKILHADTFYTCNSDHFAIYIDL